MLMVEDDANDICLMQHALQAVGGQQAHFVQDGEEAIAYLMGNGKYADRIKFPMPNIILTDIKMPKIDGLEFLRWLRKHPQNAIIPTIVFSSSHHESDVRQAYQLGANSYMTKPTDLDTLVELIRMTYEYWSHCERPRVPEEWFQPVPEGNS